MWTALVHLAPTPRQADPLQVLALVTASLTDRSHKEGGVSSWVILSKSSARA